MRERKDGEYMGCYLQGVGIELILVCIYIKIWRIFSGWGGSHVKNKKLENFGNKSKPTLASIILFKS